MSGRYSDKDNAPSEYDEERYEDNDNDTEQRREDDDSQVDPEDGDDDQVDPEDGDDSKQNESKNGEGEESEEDESENEQEDDQYYDEEEYREEDPAKEEGEDEGRSKCLYCTICCCCLLLIIAAIVIGILLSRKKKIEPAPTEAPTIFGGGSVPSSSVPPFVEGSPNGDTTVYKDGPLQSQPQGEQEIMLIQSGEEQDPNFPDTYGLMNWHWDEVGYPWYNEDDLADYDVTGELCLQHVQNTNQGSTGATTYSICRLPSSFPGDELETSTSTGYNYVMPTDCMGQEKVDFDVKPDDETVCADVTPLINVHPPFVATGTSPAKLRGLQENNFQNMLFMLDNIKSEQRASDEFFTRQARDNSPTLRLTMTPRSGSGSGTTGNSTTGANAPTISPAPTTISAPTASPAPNSGPTVSPAPTTPNTPCGVCGDGPAGAPLRDDYDVSIPADIAPDSVTDGMATCAEIEEICLAGECSAEVCSGLEEVRQACGCPGAGGPTLCSICPPQTTMTKPDESILDLLTSFVSPGMLEAAGDNVTCAEFNDFCMEGECGEDVCLEVPDVVSEPCGCTPSGGSDPSEPPDNNATTAAPTTSAAPEPPDNNAPTTAPTISAAPSVSPAPTYKAEFDYCGICGIGPTPNPLKEDVPISIPPHLAPKQVKDGNATCAELESYCQEGYCRPLTCRVLKPIRGICGCPNADPPCSICGPGKNISNADAALNLDPAIAVPGYDQSMTCGELNGLCAEGYCSSDRCEAYPDVVTEACGCTDTIPDFAVFSSGDTTIYPNGPQKAEPHGTLDTMLVQGGVSDSEETPPAYSLVEFTVTDTDYEEFERWGFATIDLCLHHVVNVEADRKMTYRACLVPNADGLESATGDTIDYSIPSSCTGDAFSLFTVKPDSERVCATVTDMVRDNVTGPTTVTFMVDAQDGSDQPGDSFYTQEADEGRRPTLQFVDVPSYAT